MAGLLPDYLLPLYPEIVLCLATLALLLTGVYVRPKVSQSLFCAVALIIAATLTLVLRSNVQHVVTLNGMFIADAYTQLGKLLLLGGVFCVLLISSKWLTEEGGKSCEYVTLVLFAVLGLMLLLSAENLLALYMALELASLALYVLASFNRDSLRSSEAGLKYFVLGALASGMFLFGASLVYGFTGSIYFDAIGQFFSSFNEEGNTATLPGAPIVGMILIIIALFFKLSAAPFHMWTPDVYEGAPTPVTAFFAIAPKIAVILLLVRVLMVPFADAIAQWQQVVILASVLSMLVGAFAALMQTNLKRLLAYSSIGHVGFMLMGVATGTSAGAQGVLVYLGVYIFMSVGAFGCVLFLRRGGIYLEELRDLAGLSRAHPLLALTFAVFMFSMAGIPPLAGFFGKMYIVLAAVGNGLVWLAVIGLLTSVVSCYYYLKIVKLMYFDEPVAPLDTPSGRGVWAGIWLCFFVTVCYVFSPSMLIDYAKAASQILLP